VVYRQKQNLILWINSEQLGSNQRSLLQLECCPGLLPDQTPELAFRLR
jgi:hypothetical protein